MKDVLVEEAAKHLTELIFGIMKGIGGKVWESISKKGKETSNYLHSFSQNYVNRYYNRHGYTQVLGMNEPMFLSNVFVDVSFLNDIATEKYTSIEQLKKTFIDSKNQRNSHNDRPNKIDGISAIEENYRLMVVGGPGSGKSTYLRKIGIEALGSKNKVLNNYIPILIELKNIDNNNSINDLILKELEISNFPYPKDLLEHSLNRGNLLILLDGLDEVPSEIESYTIKSIRNFCDQYYNNKFIVSCRIAAYKGGLTNFKNIEISNLDNKQIENFVHRWFKEKSKSDQYLETVENFIEKIHSQAYVSTLELAHTPLLLTLLCLVYYHQQDFPKNRSILYRDAINVLLKEWNAEKRIHSSGIYKDMTLPFEEMLLSNIAHNYFIKNEYFFDKKELSSYVSKFINENLNAPKYLDGSEIIETISVQQGIFVERAKNIYSFSHLTFQEYFTAKYIDDYGLYDEYINNNLLNPRWREIFILLCGITKSGSDNILNEIFKKTNEEVKDDKNIQTLLYLANINTINKNTETLLLNFLLIIAFATNIERGFYYNILNLTKEIDDSFHQKISNSWITDKKPHIDMHYSLYLKLITDFKQDSLLIPTLEYCMSKYKNQKDSENISNDFCSISKVEFIHFDNKSKEVLKNFINNLQYMFQCKKSSILVTKSNWSKIDSNIINSYKN